MRLLVPSGALTDGTGVAAGWVSTCLWAMVLFPQILKNHRRRSTEGLSLTWAFANFTASLINIFFVFRAGLPVFTKVMAVYMPCLEAVILLQFWVYNRGRGPGVGVGAAFCAMWLSAFATELLWPAVTPELQWIAVVLWCVETLPQLAMNSQRGAADGQAALSVLITVIGKTSDVLSAYLAGLPAQTRALAFYSSVSAFVNALQVVWYWDRRGAPGPDDEDNIHYAPLPAPRGDGGPDTTEVRVVDGSADDTGEGEGRRRQMARCPAMARGGAAVGILVLIAVVVLLAWLDLGWRYTLVLAITEGLAVWVSVVYGVYTRTVRAGAAGRG